MTQTLEDWREAERATARSTALREAAEEAAASAQLAEEAARLTADAANAAAMAANEAARAASATAAAAKQVMHATQTEASLRREDENAAVAVERTARLAHDAAVERTVERYKDERQR